jgi:hypothetical protein
MAQFHFAVEWTGGSFNLVETRVARSRAGGLYILSLLSGSLNGVCTEAIETQ